ncbi:hypothetical protein [Mucilaginibacter sp. UYCu711]|uniref:hypothetical protein n=1 Tax=Mucilaginibacter sp. UYCu711 TaxID=3156339 RepID=UPI003D1C32CF
METTDTIEAMNNRIHEATIQLREDNFNRGIPFMMFSDNLPDGEAYLEYPDGKIEVVRIDEEGEENNLTTVKILSKVEAERVRIEYGL